MNKKISLGITISLMAIAAAVTFVLTWSFSQNIYNVKIAGVQQREEIYSKLQDVDTTVRGNYTGEIDDQALIESIMSGYINGIGDRYAMYMTADEYYSYQQLQSGVIVGTGLACLPDESGYLKVTDVFRNSPAEDAGIKVGDLITTIDDKSVLESGSDEALSSLDGDEGTKLTVIYQRDGVETTVALIRKSFNIVSVTSNMENGIGYIKITAINDLTADQFENAVDDLETQGVKAFVFDVRNVSSEYYTPLKQMVNRVVGAAIIATAEYKNGSTKDLLATDSEKSITVPTSVLINNGTSGAAELFAVSLRDYGDSRLVGMTSAGKGVMQAVQGYTDGSAVMITVAEIMVNSIGSYNEKGLKPDYTVEPTENSEAMDEATTDVQLKKALEILETRISGKEEPTQTTAVTEKTSEPTEAKTTDEEDTTEESDGSDESTEDTTATDESAE